jgi:phosphatidylglycerophosphate synthase
MEEGNDYGSGLLVNSYGATVNSGPDFEMEREHHDDTEAHINRELGREFSMPMLDESGAAGPEAAWTPPTKMTAEDVQKAAEAKEDEARRAKLLLISFVLMVAVGLGNKIFNVLQFLPMYNYPLFINMLTTFVYIPVSFAYIFPMIKYGKAITAEALAVPQYKFMVMGILDSIAGIMQSLAVNYIANGSLFILLSQAAIPVSMVISWYFLKTRYTISQYVGATVVGVGVVVALEPFFVNPNSGKGQNVVLWSFIMIASAIPQCLSSVYKEKALGDADIDAVYLNGWVAVYQFVASFPLLLPSAPSANIAIEDVPQNLWNGALCLAGVNTITGGDHPDDCAMSAIYVSVYLIFNIGYNILIILILKYGSSNVLWLSMTIMVPLGNVSFTLPFMPNRTSLEATDIIALVVIMAGLTIYRFWDKVLKRWQAFRSRSRVPVKIDSSAPMVETIPSTPDSPLLMGSPGDKPGEPGTPARGLHIHVTGKKKKTGKGKKGKGRSGRAAGASSRVPQSESEDQESP